MLKVLKVVNKYKEGILKKIKVKPLTKEQILISIDRLTRFKHPEDKYLRVFFDILTANLIEPKIKKSDLEKTDYKQIKELAQYIINYSLECLGYNLTDNYLINQRLYDYEKSIFQISEETEELLKNKINYDAALNLINENSCKNLKWLKILASENDIEQKRNELSLRFPVKKVIIAEGATEETLLPEFAKICDCDFDKEGIYILSAGGKNQVVKLYYKLIESLKLPIFILLDKDAKENLEEIKPKLREQDKIHLVACGEFEDMLPRDLIKRTLEYELSNISILETEILNADMPTVKILEEVFKTRGMHEFKKAEFARMIKNNIRDENDLSSEINEIIKEIKSEIYISKKNLT